MKRSRTLLCASLTLSAALAAPLAQAKDMVISIWDGYMAPDALEKFQKATGIEADKSLHATNEEIMGKLMASGGEGYDVVFVSAQFAEILQKQGLLAEMDAAKVPNLKNLYPEAQALAYDPGNHFSAPYTWGTTGICYRSDKLAQAPASWNDLLKPSDAVKGKLTLLATDRWLLGAGFLANGWSVNEADPAHISQVRDELIQSKKRILSFDDTTFYSKLASGETVMAHAWDGWCNYGTQANASIKFVVPKEGSDLWVDTMVVMKSSKNLDAAYKFVNFMLEKDNHAWVAENILYKVPNQAAMAGLSKELLAQYPNLTTPPAELVKQQLLRDVGGSTQKAYTRAVTEIMAAQ
ncbi:spermidine/putrescine ABC transporter substrate-binding protein [Pseudomonas alcaligenes]|uniref:Putrescine-binding periplasmic protein n=1 Tax=Aquipseudomonas alcaligenes TaxID=43263 RepID=A0ABR7RX16_AQUAC|nr:spermidine/putrescine ABC transporter substrate-binding protein [Pseudomonas alcaligenes]MBC9249354.1 spermidine/putrescine ABC transporter substrate-binding protein [Pseudomonas alcaligenes]